jgi:hypothetical protein
MGRIGNADMDTTVFTQKQNGFSILRRKTRKIIVSELCETFWNLDDA